MLSSAFEILASADAGSLVLPPENATVSYNIGSNYVVQQVSN